MSGSSYIRSALIVVEYRNCRRTLNVYLLFAILLGQIKLKLNYSQSKLTLKKPPLLSHMKMNKLVVSNKVM